MGPSALRIAGLNSRIEKLGYQVIDRGNLEIEIRSRLAMPDTRMKYVDEIVKASEAFAEIGHDILNRGNFPLFLGGDHSMALGSLAGVAAYCREQRKKLGVIWIDAHADMNTPETTPSGNVHGMPLAANLGIGDPQLTSIKGFSPKLVPKFTSLIGIRSIDDKEVENIRHAGVKVYTMADIDRRGTYPVITEVIDFYLKSIDHLHISFDTDSLDPDTAPGVGTPVRGGFTFREAHTIMESIAGCGILGSFEITEVNPMLDIKNQTADLMVNLLESALGKKIL
jgi:arginase